MHTHVEHTTATLCFNLSDHVKDVHILWIERPQQMGGLERLIMGDTGKSFAIWKSAMNVLCHFQIDDQYFVRVQGF